jgi:Protein of unknown function (DUF3606)
MCNLSNMEKDKLSLEKLCINIADVKDVLYWCDRLNCEQIDLVNAVRAIGSRANMVDMMLVLNKWKGHTHSKIR